MYYQIKETLVGSTHKKCLEEASAYPFVAVLTPEEWGNSKDTFDIGIDRDHEQENIYNTKADVNYDAITGTFRIPDRSNVAGDDFLFAFALDEKGVVFIDVNGYAGNIIRDMAKTRKWHAPGLERFLCDFLDRIIREDRSYFENLEKELKKIEDELAGDFDEQGSSARINAIRSDLLEMRTHYEQLLDLVQVFEENDNDFFRNENLRLFKLFGSRASRRLDMILSLQDYTVQIRDLYQAQMGIKQNHIMTILTIVTTIFMPLTLIVGWYGMNFTHMPELESPYAYPIVILVCLLISSGSLYYFKKKKWL